MSFPKLVPPEQIARMREEQARLQPESLSSGQVESAERKELWLSAFQKSLSPKIACRKAGVSESTYRRWRRTDPDFAEALNETMLDWREEVWSSVIGRAVGYLKPDPESESGFVEDADGMPIRFDASDSLAKALLDRIAPTEIAVTEARQVRRESKPANPIKRFIPIEEVVQDPSERARITDEMTTYPDHVGWLLGWHKVLGLPSPDKQA